MKRRKFIKQTAQAGALLTLPLPFSTFTDEQSKLTIGLVADVHQDTVHDGLDRLRFFMDDMKTRQPDFLMQMGDFCLPHSYNQPFLDLWNSYKKPTYHILGNHDMDDSFPKEKTMEWWGMQNRYYSFDSHGFHFVVLDGNKKDAPWIGFVDKEQQEWLVHDLANTTKPTLVFSHQSLERTRSGVTNGEEVRAILESANRDKNQTNVIACFSGHHHADYMKAINNIPYVQINSMAYKYLGSQYKFKRFPEHIEKAHPKVHLVFPYTDPLYTVLTVDPEKNVIHIKGCATTYISPSPKEANVPDADKFPSTITERTIQFL